MFKNSEKCIIKLIVSIILLGVLKVLSEKFSNFNEMPRKFKKVVKNKILK